MPTEAVYKVVRASNGILVSCRSLLTGCIVEYEQGLWSYPIIKGSLLFAFATLDQAASWYKSIPSDQVWEAETFETQPIETLLTGLVGSADVCRFWNHFNGITRLSTFMTPTGPAPEGTVGCQSIRLVHRIDPSEFPKVA